jgi:hypothetical protein
VEQLAPETVGVTPGLGTTREECFRSYGPVVAAVAVGQMRIAPADVEDFKRGVSIGLTAGTKGAT